MTTMHFSPLPPAADAVSLGDSPLGVSTLGWASPSSLVAVNRALAELRHGGLVLIQANGEGVLVGAAECADSAMIRRLEACSGTTVRLIITARRAAAMGMDPGTETALSVNVPDPVEDSLVALLSNPATSLSPSRLTTTPVCASDPAAAAVPLTKLARLLPAAVAAPLSLTTPLNGETQSGQNAIPTVAATDITAYHQTAAQSLRPVGEARVPLEGAENSRIIAFRPADGGIEHLAIVIGSPDPEQPILARLHSECFTGDLLGSLRCDCGDQLRGAILAIADKGAGVVLYLAQEGRGIGLVNKLRAYQLQDSGFNTFDANGHLGFDDDERLYQPAAEMLRQLGFGSVRLMTNNPSKVEALARHGITVADRIPHIFQPNAHNLSYLRAKAIKGGHLF